MALNVTKYGNKSKLRDALAPSDTTLRVAIGEGTRFALPAGDYFYATIHSFGRREVVKVARVSGDTLTVVRGQDNTTAQAFNPGSCISIEWNPQQLCEFVRTCGAPTSNVPPGTYCLTCDTCLTISADGRITDINRSAGCP